LPRPRDVFRVRFSPEFGRLHEALWDELKALGLIPAHAPTPRADVSA